MSRRRGCGCLPFLIFALLAVVVLLLGQRRIWKLFYPISYRSEILRASERYDLDPDLIAAVARTESNWQPSAVSRSGAIGLMQIMPETGRWAAQKIGLDGYSEKSLYDPAISVTIGSWYLDQLSAEFDGDVVVMLAAYNAGRGNVKQWLASEQWSGRSDEVSLIPFAETRKFVARVLAARERFHWIYGDDYWR